MEKFDVAVIGGGPAGYPAAIRAAQLGASVALIEKECLGGACLNWGCIPTKTLIAASELYWHARHGEKLGLTGADTIGFDFAAAAGRKDRVVAKLQGGIAQLLEANGVTVITGTAALKSRDRILVAPPQGGKATLVGATRTIICTGAVSAMPKFLPESDRILDSRAFLALEKLPSSLLVLGGGVIGCEFACMAARLGCKVTIVELLKDIMMTVDVGVRRELRRHMEKALGIRILTGAKIADVKAGSRSVQALAGEARVKAGVMLVSTGRRPNTAALGLENAGLRADRAGFLATDAYCRTRVANIFAAGDLVAGGTQLAHAATAQGVAAAENACNPQPRKAETLVPACIFTSPEIGMVGLTSEAAKAGGIEVRTGRFAFAGLGKALAAGETEGFVQWVADASTGQLLGAHAIGPHATELIAEAAVAIRAELTAEELGRTIHCHPTLSEGWMEAAHALHGQCIHAPPSRRRG